MTTSSVPTHWTLHLLDGPAPTHLDLTAVPATVPGTVHTDLLAAGLIDDPYLHMNEVSLEWMKHCSWRYDTTLTLDPPQPGERFELICEGIDTVASVYVNNTHIADTENQHRTYSFDVTDHITTATTLTVDFTSALARAREHITTLGDRPRAYDNPFNMVRKMACSFGWDWGPDLQTAGLWKPVTLHRWSHVRAHTPTIITTLDDHGTGHVTATVQLHWAPGATEPAELTLTLTSNPNQPAHTTTITVTPNQDRASVILDIPNAPVWWPAGYGDQPLCDTTLTLTSAGDTRFTTTKRVGFRTIEAHTTPDEHGTPFTLTVNGQPIFIRGANWIPDDHLLTRITRDQLNTRITQARDANMNLLRVWGGGIYETDDFYDLCSEHGILVWQDFLLACAAYPEEEPFWSQLEAEARDNIARLTPYPALAVWNGGNENLWGFMDWGWQEELAGKSWGLGYYSDLFPRLLADIDPTRVYCDGSPYSPGFTAELESGVTAVHPNDQRHGTRHEWEVWNRQDYLTHLDYVPRFCSEFGHQGPPTWTTLTHAVAPENLHKDSDEFLLHQKAEDGNAKLDRGLAPHLPLPTDFADWNWATQLSQAHSVAFGVEHFRSRWPYTAGAIVWQLNDCWPVTSWAAIDSHGRNKPLYYGLAHAFAPRLITVKPVSDVVGGGEGAVATALGAGFGEDLPAGRDALGTPTVYVVNDTAHVWDGEATCELRSLDGTALASVSQPVRVAARSVESFPLPDDVRHPASPEASYVVVSVGDVRTFHYFTELKNLSLDSQAVTVAQVSPGSDSVVARGTTDTGASPVHVTLSAHSLAVDVALLVDRLDPQASVDDQLVTIQAGESHTFTVWTRLSALQVADRLAHGEQARFIVRSVNDLMRIS